MSGRKMSVRGGDAQSITLHRSGVKLVANENIEFAEFVRDVEELQSL
jgi:hypothetical protein